MATYYVDGNSGNDSGDGSDNRPWKTIGKAVSSAKPGDEVRIRTATYHEKLSLGTNNTTFKADNGHNPVIDGRYHDGLFQNGKLPTPGPGHLPGDNGNMILMRGEGIVVDGLIIRNIAGSGIGINASNCIVRNCKIDFVYNSSLKVNPGSTLIDRVILENNICTRASVRYFDPNRTGGGPQSVAGVIKMGRVRDGIIRNNIACYGMGEGINIGKGSYRTLVEGNIVHTNNHVHIYNNRSIDTIIRNNLVFHLYLQVYLGANGKVPDGIVFGDENAPGTWPNSDGGQVYNNLVIGMGNLFGVRNNKNNYDTLLKKTYIGYNTFVGGRMTTAAIQISGNMQGRVHANSIFENNIITNASRMSLTSGNISGVVFRNNLWESQPDATMRGPGDRIGDPNLVNPTAPMQGNDSSHNTNVDPRNYQLTSRSTLAIGMASDGSTANGLQPPTIQKDFFGANRDNNRDIGFHEYAGVVTELTANFSIGPGQASGMLPHTVDFTDKSVSSRPIVSREWDFGDGGTSSETNPSHTYAEPGNFDVSLTVRNDQGASDTFRQPNLVSVTEEPDSPIPGTFRRFALVRTNNQDVIAFGTQYPDLRCVIIWNDNPFHIMNFEDIVDVENSVVENGTELFWIDSGDPEENLSFFDDDEPVEQFEMRSFRMRP